MSPRVLLPLALSSALSYLAACAGGPPPAPPAPIEARVSRVFPKTRSLTQSRLSLTVEVYNPRAQAVPVQSIAYAVDTKDVAGVLKGTVPVNATLEAEQQAKLDFEVEVDLPAGFEVLKKLNEMEVVPADISGQVALGDGTTANFTKKSGLAVPSVPQFIVFDAQAAQYEKKGLDVTFFLRLVNDNAFALSVQSVKYTVSIAGKEMRSDEAGVGTRLTSGAAEEYEVGVILDESSFDELDALMASGVVDYVVAGAIQTKEMTVPFEHVAKIDLGASE